MVGICGLGMSGSSREEKSAPVNCNLVQDTYLFELSLTGWVHTNKEADLWTLGGCWRVSKLTSLHVYTEQVSECGRLRQTWGPEAGLQ